MNGPPIIAQDSLKTQANQRKRISPLKRKYFRSLLVIEFILFIIVVFLFLTVVPASGENSKTDTNSQVSKLSLKNVNQLYGPPKPTPNLSREESLRRYYSTSTTTTTAPKRVEVHAPSSMADEDLRQPSDIESVSHDAAYWLEILRDCETHGNYQSNTGNGYYGAYQFSYGTWRSMDTDYERADLAPPEIQDDAAYRLMLRAGTHSQFPGCSKSRGIPNKF